MFGESVSSYVKLAQELIKKITMCIPRIFMKSSYGQCLESFNNLQFKEKR